MKILVIGNGAREHALLWALGRGQAAARGAGGHGDGPDLLCAPGSAGTAGLARNLPLDPTDGAAVVRACRELGIGLVVIGPEDPLAAGLVDALDAAGIPAFGPPRKAAALEASKAFARSFSERHGIPCARTARFPRGDTAALGRFLDEQRGRRVVLKKSGLAAGKGVLESDDRAELLSFGEAVLAADELLAEEYLVGRELSVFGVSAGGEAHVILQPAADHKKAGEGDTGPNTGGMGAVSPLPFADEALMDRITREIVAPSYAGMAAEGLGYRGVLFFGVMATAEGPRLLEYNVRFGDPETQSLLPLMTGDFAGFCADIAGGRLARPGFSGEAACGIVVASPGYPIKYPKGLAVDLSGIGATDSGHPEAAGTAARPEALLFHASTGRGTDGGLRTGGGRCFTAVGIGPDPRAARERAYALAARVRFEGAWYRRDIGGKVYPA